MKILRQISKYRFFYMHFEFGITKYIIPLLEIHVVDHCNLNCAGCSHFSNIADKFFIEIETIKRDLKLLSSKFIIKRISLIGGEPLLHKDLKNIIKEIKKIFPEAYITISTNGLLIPTLPKDFLIFLKNENVKFIISKYPANSDIFSKLLDIIGDFDLIGGLFIRNSFRKYININGDSDIKINFKHCVMKHCITLLDGRLYHCPFSTYVKHFNKMFNQNIREEKGIDIEKASPADIYEYIRNPIATCKYCTFDKYPLTDWKIKEAELEDWVAR